MLRAQAFEGLFTLVPILLVAVVSILLRARAVRRRKQREEDARGAPARGTPARGAPARGTPARDTSEKAPGQPIPPKRKRAATRAAPFPWQQDTVDTAPASAAPFTPQQPRSAQVTTRESYAYPPPLYLNDTGAPATAAAGAIQPRGTVVPGPLIRPSEESRMALERAAPAKGKRNLRERMEARAKAERPTVKTTARERPSITARLERLPPLKRAVIWAEILGPPGGRQ
jgi:hypothetical protein